LAAESQVGVLALPLFATFVSCPIARCKMAELGDAICLEMSEPMSRRMKVEERIDGPAEFLPLTSRRNYASED
jgi:hypothetical protein